MWREFWAEISQPSGSGESPYQWAIVAAGHFLIGAALAVLPVPAIIIALVYFAGKEIRDIRAGGRWGDGVFDAGFVYLGAAGLPLIAVAAIGAGIQFYRHLRKL